MPRRGVASGRMTTPALLPLSGRRLPPLNLGASAFPHHRATLRLSEKFILLLILSAFITLCFGAFFFLPDSSKHKRFDLGLEDVLIPHVDTSKGGKNLGGFLIHGQGHDEHRHRWVPRSPGRERSWVTGGSLKISASRTAVPLRTSSCLPSVYQLLSASLVSSSCHR